MITSPERVVESGPWNPGIESQLPWELLPLSTMFRPENVFTSIQRARDLRDLTGLSLYELVAFRPQRLALHEVLIRVMADYSVPDGPRLEDLGINFRRMTSVILSGYVDPHIREIVEAYDDLRRELAARVEAELQLLLAADSAARVPEPAFDNGGGLLRRLLRGIGMAGALRQARSTAAGGEGGLPAGAALLAGSAARRDAAQRAVTRVTSALFNRHGRIWGDHALIASLATDFACNELGSEEIGRMIEPYVAQAARCEGYRRLAPQAEPIVLNTKGASASGKSTLRPLQKALAKELGVCWEDLAVISPDIWRKQLLDYASLGDAYKYAGSFTGNELQIIDQKLDRYMARKGEAHATTHLLIDRFRFDSFAPDSDEPGKNLLTRFGHIVYLFFMITPPAETVERAWKRGLEVGRFKAVDELLAHNIEAYSGMPGLFFTWARRADKQVHYEFLDNSVPFGHRPRTVAFGWNGEINILDVKCMIDIARFRRVEVNATRAEELHRGPEAIAAEHNTQFLVQCVHRLPIVNFADHATGRLYLRIAGGRPEWFDPAFLRVALADPQTRVGLLAAVPAVTELATFADRPPRYLAETMGVGRIHTLGQWGERHQERSTADRAEPGPAKSLVEQRRLPAETRVVVSPAGATKRAAE